MISPAFANDVMSQIRNIRGNSRVHVTAVTETRVPIFPFTLVIFIIPGIPGIWEYCNGHAFADRRMRA
jgi:hypothetical protein